MSIAARRQRERQERRSAILDAADRAFLEKGFDQATMDDIAGEAELSKGTLYLYFKSKDDLFTALTTRIFGDLVRDFQDLAANRPTGLDAVRGILARYGEFITEHQQHFRIGVGRLASGNMFDIEAPSFAEHRAQIARIVDAFVTAIERGKNDGTIRAELDALQTSTQLWGAFMGTMLIRINSNELMRRFPQPVNFEKFAEGFIQLVCSGLQPANGGSRP